MKDWNSCRNILCIRPDNMGDVLMSGPAMRALKQSFGCRITLLTSAMGSLITPFMPEIDETLVYNLPWVKTKEAADADGMEELVRRLKRYHFDAAVIFTVYSQSALPSALLAFMAGIPRRLAYCRENPYGLLTDWVPDKEPYCFFTHQVQRDLTLAAHAGALTADRRLALAWDKAAAARVTGKIAAKGVDPCGKWLVLHPCVSESKREYPVKQWIALAKLIRGHTGYQCLLTGAKGERELPEYIAAQSGTGVFSLAGLLTMEEFIALIAEAPLIVSVNTAALHIAAAVNTPVLALYALTNPQHTPWKVPCRVLPFSVREGLQSKNEVIRYVNDTLYRDVVPCPEPATVLAALCEMLTLKEMAARM